MSHSYIDADAPMNVDPADFWPRVRAIVAAHDPVHALVQVDAAVARAAAHGRVLGYLNLNVGGPNKGEVTIDLDPGCRPVTARAWSCSNMAELAAHARAVGAAAAIAEEVAALFR
jgi:hypothetical protein